VERLQLQFCGEAVNAFHLVIDVVVQFQFFEAFAVPGKVDGNHVIVVVDEAYYEYVDDSNYPDTIKLQQRHSNLVITRTFSKVYGLAGLRIGYSISHPGIADILNRIRPPFNVATASQAAAIAALEDTDHMKQSLKLNHQGKNYLANQLQNLGLTYIPSAGNFLTIDMGQSAIPVYQALLREGVIVRPLIPYNMPNHLRVTIGLPEENQRLIAAFEKVLLVTGQEEK